jgi:hypothetical protein
MQHDMPLNHIDVGERQMHLHQIVSVQELKHGVGPKPGDAQRQEKRIELFLQTLKRPAQFRRGVCFWGHADLVDLDKYGRLEAIEP